MIKFFLPLMCSFCICCIHVLPLRCAVDNDSAVREEEVSNESVIKSVPSRREQFTRIMNERWENIKKIADAEPENREAVMQAAQTALLMAKNKEAIKYLRKVVEIDRASASPSIDEIIQLQRRIIGLYIRDHNINMAVVELKNLTLLQPDNEILQHEFAEFLTNNGYADRAKLVYTSIINKNPDDERALYQLKLLEENQ
ncbi:MAG: hypothetical protein C4541_12685 [Candidatus Auribacter fodinae]|uniref:Tetratricopeptide repeat protein n=1 Tax=Candidatus Auribacter fodinae TaxID=2093366 RepID=A0A3A4R1Z7_9BACT|nr:MAG: hypothetical protein C4541_12685 [Candidatus Auribacter fodinae]